MRESIGAVSLLNFVIFFILLIFAFLLGTFSYYKAFKVNNYMIAAIEKFEGFNSYSKDEIEEKLDGLAYNRYKFNCPKTTKNGYSLINKDGNIILDNSEPGYVGYCVYVKNKDIIGSTNNKDIYDSYQVTTVITFDMPVIQSVLKMRVSSKTNRIYNFECAQAPTSNIPENCK